MIFLIVRMISQRCHCKKTIVNEDYLNKRDQFISIGDYQNPMFSFARQFSEAEAIVIAAPFWDLSFPSMLKQYLEQIRICKDVMHSRSLSDDIHGLVKGLMIESYLEDGCQKIGEGV